MYNKYSTENYGSLFPSQNENIKKLIAAFYLTILTFFLAVVRSLDFFPLEILFSPQISQDVNLKNPEMCLGLSVNFDVRLAKVKMLMPGICIIALNRSVPGN